MDSYSLIILDIREMNSKNKTIPQKMESNVKCLRLESNIILLWQQEFDEELNSVWTFTLKDSKRRQYDANWFSLYL